MSKVSLPHTEHFRKKTADGFSRERAMELILGMKIGNPAKPTVKTVQSLSKLECTIPPADTEVKHIADPSPSEIWHDCENTSNSLPVSPVSKPRAFHKDKEEITPLVLNAVQLEQAKGVAQITGCPESDANRMMYFEDKFAPLRKQIQQKQATPNTSPQQASRDFFSAPDFDESPTKKTPEKKKTRANSYTSFLEIASKIMEQTEQQFTAEAKLKTNSKTHQRIPSEPRSGWYLPEVSVSERVGLLGATSLSASPSRSNSPGLSRPPLKPRPAYQTNTFSWEALHPYENPEWSAEHQYMYGRHLQITPQLLHHIESRSGHSLHQASPQRQRSSPSTTSTSASQNAVQSPLQTTPSRQRPPRAPSPAPSQSAAQLDFLKQLGFDSGSVTHSVRTQQDPRSVSRIPSRSASPSVKV